jgi:hypothetical protein
MCVCELSNTMQQKNVRFSDCGKFLFWKNLQLLEDCKKTHPKFTLGKFPFPVFLQPTVTGTIAGKKSGTSRGHQRHCLDF